MLWQYIIMAMMFPLSPAQMNPYPSSSDMLTQILDHLRSIDHGITDIKLAITRNERRIDTLYYGEAAWSEWNEFSTCPQTCVPGSGNETRVQSRSRTCTPRIPAATHADPKCPGNDTDTRDCLNQPSCLNNTFPSRVFGGIGEGTPFDDVSVWNNRNITAIRLLCGDNVYSIQYRYGDEWGPKHGDASCYSNPIENLHTLNPTEYIKIVKVWYTWYVRSIRLITNERNLPGCGSTYGMTSISTITGTRLMYISGMEYCKLGAIQFHWARD